MTVGIAGLGLIGGSLAKAYKEKGHTVLGYDRDDSINSFAVMSGAMDGVLTKENAKECDVIFIALFPVVAISFFREWADFISPETLVIDCCGTKEMVCAECFRIAEEHGLTFVGGHPMAGTHKTGFKASRANLFNGASMVIVPPRYDDIEFLERIKDCVMPAGFGKVTVTTADEHDRMIAFTSQMAHIISNAYIKSPTAGSHKGFSAGSYKDLTRVAWLNPDMWTELFLENKENLIYELDILINSLSEYREAIKNEDYEKLHKILDDGRKKKEEVDGVR